MLTADKGFNVNARQMEEFSQAILMAPIGKKGNRTEAETWRERSAAFKAGQRFWAGSKGKISVLKLVYKSNRCLFKGFKNYTASVYCHNLVLLTRL